MSRSGIQHPDTIDLTTQAKDGTVRLILSETNSLTAHDIPALKQKLDNYITFARNGLADAYPATRGCPVRIRIDLYAQPDELVRTFLRHYRSLAVKQGFGLEVSLDQQEIAL